MSNKLFTCLKWLGIYIFLLSSIKEWFRISYKEDSQGGYPFDEIPAAKFSRSSLFPCKFVIQAFAGGLSLEIVTSRFSDSFQYSGRFQQGCLLSVRFWVFYWFPIPSVSSQTFGNRSRCSNHNWYYRYPHVQVCFFFQFSSKVYVFVYLFTSIYFSLWLTRTAKSTGLQGFFV